MGSSSSSTLLAREVTSGQRPDGSHRRKARGAGFIASSPENRNEPRIKRACVLSSSGATCCRFSNTVAFRIQGVVLLREVADLAAVTVVPRNRCPPRCGPAGAALVVLPATVVAEDHHTRAFVDGRIHAGEHDVGTVRPLEISLAAWSACAAAGRARGNGLSATFSAFCASEVFSSSFRHGASCSAPPRPWWPWRAVECPAS